MEETVSRWTKYLSLAVHELRAPLTPLSGWVRMLVREQAGPITPTQRKALEEISHSVERLTALIGDLSAYGQLLDGRQPLAPGTTDLAVLLTELAAQVPQDDGRARVRLESGDEVMLVSGDRARLRQAFESVVRALRRETLEGMELVIHPEAKTRDNGRHSWIVAASPAIGDALRHALPDQMEPFDIYRGGCGLALPLACEVVERYRGRLHALKPEAVVAATGQEPEIDKDGRPIMPKQAGCVIELPLI